MKTNLKFLVLILAVSLVSGRLMSQDLIFKTNGDTIKAKITEVGTNAISFKKFAQPNGPTFVENKTDIIMIKYANGEIKKFADIPSVSTNTTSVMSNTAIPTNTASTSSPGSDNGKNKIERDGTKYMINGKKAKKKQVDELLSKSNNPAIQVPLKAAKMTSGAQKIVKLVNIPASIGGGFTTLLTFVNMYNDIQRGRATTKSYLNAGISLAGTLVLPITNKILKKKSGKMYDKLIDMYNVTN